MPILCEPKPEADELSVSIGGDVRTADSLRAAARLLADDPAETLVVIGPETTTDEALTYSAALRLDRPGVGVILVREQVDVDLLTRALQSGVREVVATGDHSALRAACRRSREVSRRMLFGAAGAGGELVPEGGMITVFAPKGGCGKTMLSVNLGVVLARETGQRVCVVDLNLGFGDVAINVQLDPVRTVLDALPMTGHLDVTGATAVVGYRVNRRDTGWKLLQSRIANAVRNRLNGETIRDTGCSLKAFRAEAVRALPLYSGMHRFLPTLVKLYGGTVAEVPVQHRPRRFGTTKYGMWNRVWRSFADALAVRWMQRRALRYRVKEELL